MEAGNRGRGRGRGHGRGRATAAEPVVMGAHHVDDQDDATRLPQLVKELKKLGGGPFIGGTDHNIADQWIRKLKKCFRLLRCSDHDKVELATYLLEDKAMDWWDSATRGVDVDAFGWDDFEKLFLEKYFPDTVREQLDVEFQLLEQGSMTATEYEAKFDELSRFAAPMTELAKARKFERGLNSNIRSGVVSHRHKTVALVLESAAALEQSYKKHLKDKETKREAQVKERFTAGSGSTSGNQGNAWKKQKTRNQTPVRAVPVNQRAPVTCYNCKELGHISTNCPKPKAKACFNCDQPGHLAKDCTLPRRVGQVN